MSELAERFRALHVPRHAVADPEPVGRRFGAGARLAGVPGARDHQQRVRGDAGPDGRDGLARRGDRPWWADRGRRRRPRLGRPRERVRRRSGRRCRDRPGRRRCRAGRLQCRGLQRQRDLRAVPGPGARSGGRRGGGGKIVITARAENFLHDRPDLADTINRLQSFAAVGADVVYAPGVVAAGDIGTLVSSVARPVNVLALPNAPTVAELADLGVARISVGGAFAFAALDALAEAGRELLDSGSYGFWARSIRGRQIVGTAFGD